MKLARRIRYLPVRVTALYCLFAGLWIVFSDSLLLLVGLDASSYAWFSMAKGLGFVAVSGVLLYLLLQRNARIIGQAQLELVWAEARLRDLVQALPHGVQELDAQGRIRFCNPAAARMLGKFREELVNRPLTDFVVDTRSRETLECMLDDGRAGRAARGSLMMFPFPGGEGASAVQVDWAMRETDDTHATAFLLVLTDISDRLEAEDRQRRQAAVLGATSDLVAMVRPDGWLMYMNASGRSTLGVPAGHEVTGLHVRQFLPPGSKSWLRLARAQAHSHGTWSGDVEIRRYDGVEIPVSQVLIAHTDGHGRVDYYSTVMRDISEQRRADEALQRSQEQYRMLVDNTREGLVVVQRELVRFVNPHLLRMLGYAEEQFFRGQWLDFVHREDRGRVLQWYRSRRTGDMPADTCGFRILAADGEVCWVEAKAVDVHWEGAPATLSFLSDITGQMEAQSRLEYLADYDELTGLPNRTLLLQELSHLIGDAGSGLRPLAVVYVDLSRFQLFNDSHGHQVGDQLIRIAGSRLAAEVSRDEFVARATGDEFALLLVDARDTERLTHRVRRILERVAEVVQLGGHEFYLNARAGISMFPVDGEDPSILLRNAANALELARGYGSGGCHFYSAALNRRAVERLSLEADLRHALNRGQFRLEWQPQADLASGRILGAEALLRWDHPDRGSVSPAQFIPLLEDTGLIVPVGHWVLEQSCHQQRLWREQLGVNLRVSINLSAGQVALPALPGTVAAVLADTGASPDCIELEITESSLIREPEEVAARLEELKQTGVGIAVDDFGTGYSSLAYFRRFPVDSLKIDKSFIAEVTWNVDSAEIARAIVAMGQSLRIRVIAEGVETVGQLRFLQRQGCDWMQGFLLARPMTAEGLADVVVADLRLPGLTWEEMAPRVLILSRDERFRRQVEAAVAGFALDVTHGSAFDEAMECLSADRVVLLLVDLRFKGPSFARIAGSVRDLYPWVTVAAVAAGNAATTTPIIDDYVAGYPRVRLPGDEAALDRILRSATRHQEPLREYR